jgi:uncharacterized membrane protein required for colicin V production
MIWFDYLLIFILILNLYKGLREGLLRQVAALTSFFIAFYAALCLSCTFGRFLEKSLKLHKIILTLSRDENFSAWSVETLTNMLAFLLVFFVLCFVLKHFARKLRVLNRVPIIGPLNALLGAIAGGIKGMLIIFLIISLFTLIKTEFWMNTMETSAVAALSSHYLPLLYGFISNYIVKRLGTLV